MASRTGTWVYGTDGRDFEHREKVASQYQVSALNKARLRTCIFFHFLLFIILTLKVADDILDRLDIFILELQELYIPKPLTWEWLWMASILFQFVGLSACRKNRVSTMITYAVGTFLFAFCPIVFAGVYFFNEMYQYVDTRESEGLELWQGYPIALLWYVFITLAFQVHFFSLVFAIKLIRAWRLRGARPKTN